MKKLFTLITLLGMCVSGAWAEEENIFTEDFSDDTYNVTWGGTSAGGISPSVTDGVLTVENGSQSGDRGAYVSFGDNSYKGSAHLTFEMAMTKSGWSGKNNTFYIFAQNTTARYPDATNAVITITQDYSGYISINGTALNANAAYSGTMLIYDLYLNAASGSVELTVSNGTTQIKKVIVSTTAQGIGGMHLTFNKNYGSFSIDNISLSSYTPTVAAHNYTINAAAGSKVLKQITTGAANENAEYSVSGLPYALFYEGEWYKIDDTNVVQFGASFTMGTTDEIKSINYTQTSDFDYFFEAEDLTKSRSAAAELVGTYSGGKAPRHYSNSYWWTSALTCGNYSFSAPYKNQNSTETTLSIYLRDSSGNLYDTGKTITGTGKTIGTLSATDIMIPEGYSLVINNTNSYNSNLYIDYVTLKKTGEASYYTKTLGSQGYGTFSAAVPVIVPKDVVVYTSTYADNTVTATADNTITVIPANTGVIVKGTAEAEVEFQVTTDAGTPIKTALTAAPNGVTGDGATTFGLLRASMEFAIINSSVTLPANYAYLKIPSGSDAKTINFVVEENTATAISTVNAASTTNSAAYNLAGQRVNTNAKGVVIINGKKVMNK